MDKIAALTGILELDSTNVFARYSLAMEHAAAGSTEAALKEFSNLIRHSPDYVPAYQMCAQTLAQNNRAEEAVPILQQGIEASSRTGNLHAATEMQALLDELSH